MVPWAVVTGAKIKKVASGALTGVTATWRRQCANVSEELLVPTCILVTQSVMASMAVVMVA